MKINYTINQDEVNVQRHMNYLKDIGLEWVPYHWGNTLEGTAPSIITGETYQGRGDLFFTVIIQDRKLYVPNIRTREEYDLTQPFDAYQFKKHLSR